MKKRGRQTGKERFTIHASLCGGGDLLKALGSVASSLADRLFNLSNDSWPTTHSRIHDGGEGADKSTVLTLVGQPRIHTPVSRYNLDFSPSMLYNFYD
ncbi:MAG: hypothetical protein ACJ8CB_36380 [Ktedonobacteraceae bacterium]